MDETTPHYLLVVDRVNNLDTLELQLEVEDRFYSDTIGELQALRKKITHAVESATGLSVNVKLVEPKTIERSEGKAKRVIDKRKLV
jgi:phenylacetate-CoA ligase